MHFYRFELHNSLSIASYSTLMFARSVYASHMRHTICWIFGFFFLLLFPPFHFKRQKCCMHNLLVCNMHFSMKDHHKDKKQQTKWIKSMAQQKESVPLLVCLDNITSNSNSLQFFFFPFFEMSTTIFKNNSNLTQKLWIKLHIMQKPFCTTM